MYLCVLNWIVFCNSDTYYITFTNFKMPLDNLKRTLKDLC